MTPSKERLEKIASWRETYGNDRNVMLPAEEAEAMARCLLAAEEQQATPACYALTDMRGEIYNTHSSAENAEMYRNLIHQSDDSLTLRVTPLYLHPQQGNAVQVTEHIASVFIAAIEKEQEKLFEEDYLMDSKDCIDVIREEILRMKSCRAAMLTSEPVSSSDELNSPVIPDDVRRMDWLVSKTVNVREPQVYGSHSLFWSQTTSDDWSEAHATTLREQIDAAMETESAPKPEVQGE